MGPPIYSFVFPIFNEEETLPELFQRMTALMSVLDGSAEVILVNDGSRDGSAQLLNERSREDSRFKVAHLSRNFGHQIAITAGMDLASGQAITIMDADMQDPPEVTLALIERWREGYEVVYAVRSERQGESLIKNFIKAAFYRLLNRLTDMPIPVDVGDFRLVDRRALDAFRTMREENRYVRGLFTWVGFRQIGVPYVRPGRFAGESKYPYSKLIRLALDGVISFSTAPLRLVLVLGAIISVLAFIGGVLAIISKLTSSFVVTGWTSLICAVSFFGGIHLLVLGVIGEYIGRIYGEVKRRPLYFVREAVGFEDALLNDGAHRLGLRSV